MKKIMATGYSEKEARKSKNSRLPCRCYLCKRKVGDRSVLGYVNDDGAGFATQELDFEKHEFTKGDTNVEFILCDECSVLLQSFVEDLQEPDIDTTPESITWH